MDDRCVAVTERDAGCTDCKCTLDDCAAVAPCAESRCNAGSCEVVVFDERCAPLGICDAVRGCVEAPDAGPTRVDGGLDAGAEDAGTDAGTDAGIDAGPTRGPVGATCDEATDCLAYRGLATPTCLERLRDGTSFVGGYCTMRCADAGDCPDGTACWRAGEGKPATFDFLGFTHICGKSRSGNFLLLRRTTKKRMRAKLQRIREDLLRHRHLPPA